MSDHVLSTAAPDYNEEVVRKFIIAGMFWGVIAFALGTYLALELTWPAFNLGFSLSLIHI